jgi:hypothetical protein
LKIGRSVLLRQELGNWGRSAGSLGAKMPRFAGHRVLIGPPTSAQSEPTAVLLGLIKCIPVDYRAMERESKRSNTIHVLAR